MVGIAKQRRRAEGKEFADHIYLETFPIFCDLQEASSKTKGAILSSKEQQASWVQMMGRFNLQISSLTVELASLKNSRGFISGYWHIYKKLGLIPAHNECSLDKISSASVRGKWRICLHCVLNLTMLDVMRLDFLITAFLFDVLKFCFSLLADHEW